MFDFPPVRVVLPRGRAKEIYPGNVAAPPRCENLCPFTTLCLVNGFQSVTNKVGFETSINKHKAIAAADTYH